MRIVANETAYDTRVVRRVLLGVHRGLGRHFVPVPFWAGLRIKLVEGRHVRVDASEFAQKVLRIFLPRLQGTEFISLARQQHGGSLEHDHGGVYTITLALEMQAALIALLGTRRGRGWRKTLLDEKRTLKGLPALIPLRIIKPAPPRDKLQEKLARTLELKKSWQRKAKLAATKLKKLTSLQKRYEKQLAQREVAP